MMVRDLVAGIDSSTQSCTVMLRRLDDGSVAGLVRTLHPPVYPPISEQDPQVWWDALLECLRQLQPLVGRIAALSVGGQGHGLVLLDGEDRALRPAKLWNDTQSAPDAEHLLTLLPAEEWARETGSIPSPALTVSKLAWTERTHPGLVARARRIMLPFDYLVYRMSGRAVTERGGSSGTGYFDPSRNVWAPHLFNLAVPAVDSSAVLPEIIDSGARAGVVSSMGDLNGAVVGAGSGDNMTAALGLGIREGDTVISLGTSGCVYGLTTQFVSDALGQINGYADATVAFLPMVTTLNAARVTDTFRKLLGLTTDRFDELALSAPPGAQGLRLVPYLDGERSPNLPNATGLLTGLRTGMGQKLVARAAVEGVICNLLEGYGLLAVRGVKGDGRLILTGGASKSQAYRQIFADLSGRSVWISSVEETAAAGAAVQAVAALLDAPVAEIAARWAPQLTCVAEVNPDVWSAAESIRAAYRAAAVLAR
jgi:xylulokinase